MNTTTSQKKVTRNEQVNLVDLFYYLTGNWYWFVLSVLVSLGVASWFYAKTPFMYESQVTAVVRNPGSETRTASFDTYDRMVNTVSISQEELQLKSVTLMSEVVKALDADVHYSMHPQLRNIELYSSNSPVVMHFDRDAYDPGVFVVAVTPVNADSIRIRDGISDQIVALGDIVTVGTGRAYFTATQHFDSFYGQEIRINKISVERAAQAFISRLQISHSRSIIKMKMTDYSARRAADVINTLMTKYNESAVEEKNRVAVSTEQFINERLAIIAQELGEVEGSLAGFKSSNQLMSVGEKASMYLGDSRSYNAGIVDVETRNTLANYLRDYINESASQYLMIPANTGLQDGSIDAVIAQYNETILRREKLIAASSPESPAVLKVNDELATLRFNILELIQNFQHTLDIRRQNLSEQEIAALQNFTQMPGKELEMREIERQQSIKQSLYIYLLNKREENALSQSMAVENIRAIDPAVPNHTPVSPQHTKIILLGLLIGLLIPIVILIARLFLDTKIRTRKEIEEFIEVPFLAEIPRSQKMRRSGSRFGRREGRSEEPSPFVYDANPYDVFTEAMRKMCTNLSFLETDNKLPRVIAMTSLSSEAGKTFITANMAACLVDGKQRVVLVDADMRKRSLSNVFGFRENTAGLSNYLYDAELPLDDILRKDVRDGIDFIPAGAIPPNPTELLGRPRLEELTALLRERYDYVLFDGVPVQMLADPLVIDRVVETNLLVLRSGQIDRRIIPRLNEFYEKRRLSNMAIVLNGTKVKRSHGYGFGSYGYGYGYGYGNDFGYYFDDDAKKHKRFLGIFRRK